MTEQFTRSFSIGVDSYYKVSQNLIDEGQFGSALVFTPFNYARGNLTHHKDAETGATKQFPRTRFAVSRVRSFSR